MSAPRQQNDLNRPPPFNPYITPTAPIPDDDVTAPSLNGVPSVIFPPQQLYPDLTPHLMLHVNGAQCPPNKVNHPPGKHPTREANRVLPGRGEVERKILRDQHTVTSSGNHPQNEHVKRNGNDKPECSQKVDSSNKELKKNAPIIIWEEQSIDCHGWQMLGGCLCEQLEAAFQNYLKKPDERTVSLRHQAYDFKNYEHVDAFGCVYPIRRVEHPGDCALANDVVWLWDDSDDVSGNYHDWKPYSAEILNLLERKFSANILVVDLQQEFPDMDMEYVIDLKIMVQTHKRTKTQRRLKRDKLNQPFPRVKLNKGHPRQDDQASKIHIPVKSVGADSSQTPQYAKDEDRSCKICMEQKAVFAFVPCGHVCCCGICTLTVKDCPICRKTIEKTLRVYM